MKIAIGILAILLILTNSFWVYNILDDAVTCMYSDSSFELTQKMYEQTTMIANLNVIGKHADEVLAQLTPDVYGLEPFEKEGCIIAGQVCLELNESRVITAVGRDL